MIFFITGIGQRIGLNFTEKLLKDNHTVIGTVRKDNININKLQEQYPENLVVFYKDFSSDTLDFSFWQNFIQKYSHIDCFIHCASTFIDDSANNTNISNLKLQNMVNSDTFTFSCISYYQVSIINNLPICSFITLIDQKIEKNDPSYFSYTLSKLNLASNIKFLAQSLSPKIRINGISPGLTLPSGNQTLEEFETERKSFPFGYGNDIDDLYITAIFLVHNKSITGQIITVDAGQHLRY